MMTKTQTRKLMQKSFLFVFLNFVSESGSGRWKQNSQVDHDYYYIFVQIWQLKWISFY